MYVRIYIYNGPKKENGVYFTQRVNSFECLSKRGTNQSRYMSQNTVLTSFKMSLGWERFARQETTRRTANRLLTTNAIVKARESLGNRDGQTTCFKA